MKEVNTSRQEILAALDASGWTCKVRDKPNLIAQWRRLKIVLRFDSQDRIMGAAIEQPLPFNAGIKREPVLSHRKDTVLKFIRGEKRSA